MTLTFGKHNGYDIADSAIPLSYLKWLEEQKWIDKSLREALNLEINRREGDRPGQGKVIK